MLACYSREAVTIQLERCRSSTLRRNVPVGRARGSVTAANLTSTHDSGTSALVRLSLTALSFSVRCYQHHVRMKLLSLSLAERKKERGSYLYDQGACHISCIRHGTDLPNRDANHPRGSVGRDRPDTQAGDLEQEQGQT